MLLSCNYSIKDLSINSQFYFELIHWWSVFRKMFSVEQEWRCIIWNNQEIRKITKQSSIKRIPQLEKIMSVILTLTLIILNLSI